MTKEEIAKAIKEAFEEGYHNYETPCNAYNCVEDAWEKSEAKVVHDRLLNVKPPFTTCFDCNTRDSCSSEGECWKVVLGAR
ncbi:hypothetical protein [Acinetobacter sp.]|uniref:hypothetical protein n=1 Tax=Acinetobacter sp. TaxID=472 RepID=UPI00388ECBA9